MSEQAVMSGKVLAGHNRISTQALTSLAQAATAEVFAVHPAQVRVSWRDDAGDLALAVSAPISAPSLTTVLRSPERVAKTGGSIFSRSVAAKAMILDQVQYLSGSRLSRVDVRITGIQSTDEGRVQ